MLFGALIWSGILLILLLSIAWQGQKGLPNACVLAIIGTPSMLILLQSVVLTLQVLLLAIAFWLCCRPGIRRQQVVLYSLAATALAYVLVGVGSLPFLDQEAARYPFESMADRLAYESVAQGREPAESVPAEELNRLEKELGPVEPPRWLVEVHAGHVHSFINSPGFGVGRVIRPSKPLRFDKGPESISFPAEEYEDPSKEYSPLPPPAAPGSKELAEFHLTGLLDFINKDGFGLIRDRQHVAGFEAHGIKWMHSAGEGWSIQKLELVSLLKHEKPAVYLSNNLPRMDELRSVPTRSLAGWEQDMLGQLRAGKDQSVTYRDDRIRMLGSIRAASQCLACHEVKRGTLLGAFSYQLRRTDRKIPASRPNPGQ